MTNPPKRSSWHCPVRSLSQRARDPRFAHHFEDDLQFHRQGMENPRGQSAGNTRDSPTSLSPRAANIMLASWEHSSKLSNSLVCLPIRSSALSESASSPALHQEPEWITIWSNGTTLATRAGSPAGRVASVFRPDGERTPEGLDGVHQFNQGIPVDRLANIATGLEIVGPPHVTGVAGTAEHDDRNAFQSRISLELLEDFKPTLSGQIQIEDNQFGEQPVAACQIQKRNQRRFAVAGNLQGAAGVGFTNRYFEKVCVRGIVLDQKNINILQSYLRSVRLTVRDSRADIGRQPRHFQLRSVKRGANGGTRGEPRSYNANG